MLPKVSFIHRIADKGVFSETPIHPLGCLCVRTGVKGRFCNRLQNTTKHLATRLDGYSPDWLDVLANQGYWVCSERRSTYWAARPFLRLEVRGHPPPTVRACFRLGLLTRWLFGRAVSSLPLPEKLPNKLCYPTRSSAALCHREYMMPSTETKRELPRSRVPARSPVSRARAPNR